MALATAVARRAALGPHGAAEERGRARLHVLHELRVAQGRRARGEPPTRRCSSTAMGSRCGSRARVAARRRRRVRRVLGDAPGRIAPQCRRVEAVPADRARARRSRPRSRRSPTSLRALHAGAATGSFRTRTSSGATATTACTSVTCSRHAATAGSCQYSNREAALSPPAEPRSSPSLAGSAAPDVADDRGCPVFPASNPWNTPRRQAAGRGRLGGADRARSASTAHVHADFGSGLYDGSRIGIPYVVVHGKSTPKSRVHFEYANESDKGPYPIPASPPIEGAACARRRATATCSILDRDACKLYELSDAAHRRARWAGWSGAIWNLRSNAVRPAGWTSADAAGLPILPGLARWDGDASTGADRPRAAVHRASARGAPTSIPRGTTHRARPIRRCRRWGSASA